MGVLSAERKSATATKMKRRNMSVKENEKLTVIDGETLMDMKLPPTKFCVETLLPQGISILGGAPKIGKSWMVLDLCVRIAKGEAIWNLSTQKGTTLYLCLEDPLNRIQQRLCMLTDEVPENAYFATAAGTLSEGLCEQIRNFVSEHPDTVLVAVDTFQIIRASNTDTSYANDYDDVRQMKQLADELNISILLVHHLRKQGDSDPLNKISGTTGISGAMDAIFVLDKSKRNADTATLVCTGRDIEYREMEMKLSKENCVWTLVTDSLENPQLILPDEMVSLTQFMKAQKFFSGTNSEFTELFNSYYGKKLSAKSLKQMMNRWRYSLEEQGVQFTNRRSNGQRLVDISYSSARDESAVSDVKILDGKSCVPSVPCVPVSERVALSAKTAESIRPQDKTAEFGNRGQIETQKKPNREPDNQTDTGRKENATKPC